ncbi:MAG TPA: LysR substrate-binding domain-containing protein [Methylocella sp.]|nr:LysR substrate-binding domain-containing protein [Methylocella sp.]
MFVRHLTYFVALAREKHFARAANACHITQPTLSAAIRKLEEDLKVRLVVRGQRFAGLTEEGQKALAWARQIIQDYESLRLDLAGMRKGLSGTLRLGVVPAAMPLVSGLTAQFSSGHPAATIDVRAMTSRAIECAIHAFEIDAGITYLDNEPLEHVRSLPLYEERYVFVTSDHGRHAGRRTISWREAAEERLCLLSEDMQNRRIIDRVIESAGAAVKPAIVTNSFLGICSYVRKGSFASIVPDSFFCAFGATPGLIAIKLVAPAHSQTIGLVLTSREPLPPMAAAFHLALLGGGHADETAQLLREGL